MKLTEKQQVVLAHLRDNGQLTRQEAFKLPGLIAGIYPHPKAIARYVDAVLHRMVKRGIIERERPGVYIMGAPAAGRPVGQYYDPKQNLLFK